MVAVMYAPGDLRVAEVCDGPDASGKCPRVAPGDEVPCWGLDIVLSHDDPRHVTNERILVMPGTTVCPLYQAAAEMQALRTYFSPFVPASS
jgi:hypothetical protein